MLFVLTGCVGNKSNTDNMNESNVSTVENRNDKKKIGKTRNKNRRLCKL